MPSISALVQTYTYDNLNRLKSAQETSGGNQTWKQTFTYDRYGNRNFDVANTTTLGNCPANQCNPTVDVSNNRLTTGQGYTYDLSGNLITDAQNRSFIYDAENKQKEVKDANNNSIGQYFYDGDGKRVKKISSQETTVFVYDASGKLTGEYLLTILIPLAPTTSYLTMDNLGSPRVVTDQNGNVISRRDFMPFGEEIATGLGGRSASVGYQADSVRQKFTSYERDAESDLDFAQARMYSNKLGRFTSADPLLMSGNIAKPQSWNRYSYALNNPLRLSDPTGLYIFDKSVSEEQQKKFNIAIEKARANLAKIEKLYGKESTKYKLAERALNVYGNLGEKNGVTIFAGKSRGEAEAQTEGVRRAKTTENPTGQNIRVIVTNKGFDSNSLYRTIAHEGSHAADGSDWVKSGFSDKFNPTLYKTESDAYTVESVFAQASGESSVTISGYQLKPNLKFVVFPIVDIWNSGWEAADVEKLRQSNIDNLLEFSKLYNLTPNSSRKTFIKGSVFK